jgi:hypothetical protein
MVILDRDWYAGCTHNLVPRLLRYLNHAISLGNISWPPGSLRSDDSAGVPRPKLDHPPVRSSGRRHCQPAVVTANRQRRRPRPVVKERGLGGRAPMASSASERCAGWVAGRWYGGGVARRWRRGGVALCNGAEQGGDVGRGSAEQGSQDLGQRHGPDLGRGHCDRLSARSSAGWFLASSSSSWCTSAGATTIQACSALTFVVASHAAAPVQRRQGKIKVVVCPRVLLA